MDLNNYNWKKQASAVLADKEAEIAFMKLAMKNIEEKAAPLLAPQYFLGFETVYCNNRKDKMIGVFGCRIGKNLVYIPVFFINGGIKNADLMYLSNEKQFVLLSPEWCDYLIGRFVITTGRSMKGELADQATQELDLRWIAEPPTSMAKSASERYPIGHMFGYYDGEVSSEDSKKAFDEFFKKQANEEDKHLLKKFIDDNGYDAFEKIACAVNYDYEFANNMIKFVDESDWLRPDFIDQAKKDLETIKQASIKQEESKEDKILNAKNCILIHKGKFNPFAKIASEQIENGISIEDRRDSSKFDVVYAANKNEYSTFDTFVPGIYEVLGADGTTKEFAIFSGNSDNEKRPLLMIEPSSKEILYSKNINKDDDDTESEFHSKAVDIASIANKMMAKKLDEKSYKDVVTDKPEVGKVYSIYSFNRGYISDECFKIIDHKKEEDVDVYTAVPFVYYDYLFKEAEDNLKYSFTIRVNPNAFKSNIEQRIFIPEDIEWINIKVKDSEPNIEEESFNAEGKDNKAISSKEITVVYSNFTPASIEDYELGLAGEKQINKSEIEKTVDGKYLLKITGEAKNDPVTKTAAIVKLMYDLNISKDDASDLIKEASDNGNVKFYHKKIATRMVLRPEPNFYESVDSDLGVNVFENDTKVVPIDANSDFVPEMRYGDHIPLANVENKSSEDKPKESDNKSSEENNELLLTATPNMLAQIAEKTGNKNIFEHGIIGTYARTYDAANYITQFLPDLRQGLDKLGRLLFLYLWKPADFSIYYGTDDILELEAMLTSNFRQLGELILDLTLRTKDERINNASDSVE